MSQRTAQTRKRQQQSVIISVPVPRSWHRDLKALARQEDRPLSSLVRQMIRQHLDRLRGERKEREANGRS